MNIPNWSAVVLWQIRTDTLETWEANSHFPVLCPPTWEQVVNSTKCSTVPALNKWSDKTEQDFKVGIINEDYRNNTEQKKQSGSNPIAGTRLARSLLFF